MSRATVDNLAARLAAIEMVGTGKRASDALSSDGDKLFDFAWRQLDPEQRNSFNDAADTLLESEVRLVTLLDAEYPARLRDLPTAPPFLLLRGNFELLDQPGIGVCGSRDASERGIKATTECCELAVRAGYVVVSGNARGVDLAAHRCALECGGSTIFVLPEGIESFRIRRDLREFAAPDRVLVVSQFAPKARWAVSRAMERNGTIVGLADATLAVEPGITGGTADAVKKALAASRPVAVLDPIRSAGGTSEAVRGGAEVVDRPSSFEAFLRILAAATGPQSSIFESN